MNKLTCFILALTTFLVSCKKNNDDGWSDEERVSYNEVITLQDKAAENYATWMKTMDSLEVIDQLQQFFLNDPSVLSATVGSQGILVDYANGMGGGIFLNPEDNPGSDSLNLKSFTIDGSTDLKGQIVNRKEMILLNPTYWERYFYADQLITVCNTYLPMAGYSLTKTYFDDEADVDKFTKLSGYGIIQIYTHGLWWEPLMDVFILTGEEANVETSEKYWNELKNKEILIVEASTSEFINENVYFISEKFISDHNDFSQDTVLFYGGFCYSFLGNWPNIQQTFAAGTYFGFSWSVETFNNIDWAVHLLSSLSNTAPSYPWSTVDWYDGSKPKSYYNEEENVNVSILYAGDTLFLWKNPVPGVEALTATNETALTATLNAKVNPNGSPTKAVFEFGLTTDYGMIAEIPQNQLFGREWITVSADLSNLLSDTTYHFRVRAKSHMGTTYGDDVTFNTMEGGLQLGQMYQGGIIIYLEPSGLHGLIAAQVDQGSGIVWGCGGTLIGTSENMSTGQANTSSIVAGCSDEGIAAQICNDLVLNGCDDWYLPSHGELDQMHTMRSYVGGFVDGYYWSSSEGSADNAWFMNFGNAWYEAKADKAYPMYVRAIRAF